WGCTYTRRSPAGTDSPLISGSGGFQADGTFSPLRGATRHLGDTAPPRNGSGADTRRVAVQEIAWAARGVVRITNSGRRHPRCGLCRRPPPAQAITEAIAAGATTVTTEMAAPMTAGLGKAAEEGAFMPPLSEAGIGAMRK